MISLCLAVRAQDFEKITSMCDGLCDELNDFRKQLEVETTEPDCQQFLLFNLSGVKSYKPRETGMVDGEHIGENDDSDEASDPQYELFFESLNKYENSYLLEGKIIDVSACVKYEGDSKFGGKRKPKCARKIHKKNCARKMRRDDGRVDGAAEQSPRLPNEQAPVNQHASDNVNDSRNEISKEKPDLRNMGIIKESEVGFSKSLSKKMANSGSCNESKNMTVVQEDNIVTDNQSEPQGQARLRIADKGEDVDKAPVNQHASDNVDDRRKEISKKKPELRNKGIIKESEVGFSEVLSKKMDNLGSCKVLKIIAVVQEDNIVIDNQSEPHGQASLGKADDGEDVDKALVDQHASDHVEDNTVTDNQSEPRGRSEPHGQARLRKADKGVDVDKAPVNQNASDHVDDRRNEISKKKPDVSNKGIIKESEVGFSKARTKKMDNFGSCKLSKNMTVVQEDNIVTDNQSEPQGQARLRIADKGEDVDKAPVNQHASDNVDDRRKEISKKKPELRNKGIIKESEVGFSEVLSKKMDNLGSCKVLKIIAVVQEDNIVIDNQSEPHGQASLGKADDGEDVDKALVDQHASDHVEDNTVTDNQSEPRGRSEPHGQARLRKADKGEDVDKAHYVPDSESVIQISYDGNGYQSPDPINNSESKNLCEPVGQAQPIKREKGLKCKNVVLSEHNPDTEKHLYLRPDPKHYSATKYQAVRANQVVPSEEGKEAQSKTNMPKVKKQKNVVTDDSVGNRKAVHYREYEPSYPKPSPENEDADLTQPGKKHKVQGQRKLRKVVRGSHEIKVDDAASRNDVAQIENKLLFHKPCSSKNQVTKNCIDQPRPKQSHSMFMKERVITDGSDSDVEILDSASFYRNGNPGPFVTSKKFHKSVMEDDNIKLPERTSPQFEFRRQVMNVLRKPYDKQESNRLREAFMVGSYVKFHPDLVKKLAAHRYEKGKCLAILRGFFFWLENLTKQGSFKPWEDSECLAVDPTLL
ncbi:uncharacterized protein [Primulina huaijiensis]|uniref:uncharacterized protein n=1 Tax=Primulina huaijiensis TaxID=1492673 RepID=UPI003CC6E590